MAASSLVEAATGVLVLAIQRQTVYKALLVLLAVLLCRFLQQYQLPITAPLVEAAAVVVAARPQFLTMGKKGPSLPASVAAGAGAEDQARQQMQVAAVAVQSVALIRTYRAPQGALEHLVLPVVAGPEVFGPDQCVVAMAALAAAGGLGAALAAVVLALLIRLDHTAAVQQAARSPEIQTSHGLPLAPVLGVSHEH
jgi:hypothetical protein